MTGAVAAPRVSWLVPVYDGETYLREALDSIFAQTYRDFEVVVVNDGSKDRTRGILAEYERREARLRVIDKPNGGIVSALNAGLAECRGEYIARLDADDVALPDRLAFQVRYLDEHPGCVLVGGYAVTMTSEGKPLGRTTGGRHARTDLGVFPPRVAVAMHPLITLRRSALLELGGYRASYPHAEDYDLFLRLVPYGSIENPPQDVLIYRRHQDAISVRNTELQERSAALAEVEAIEAAGFASVPGTLVEAYVRLRVFRRYIALDRERARAMLAALARDLLRVHPATVFNARYTRLRAIIAFNLWRFFRHSLAQWLGTSFQAVRGRRMAGPA